MTTDDYLPGVLVLSLSLKKAGVRYPFFVLVTPAISKTTLDVLSEMGISYKSLTVGIDNPTCIDPTNRWFTTYSKIQIFAQIEYDKLVYLDADMLVLKNIDDLFSCPHMSATDDGSTLPRKPNRVGLNSGLLVVEPSEQLFRDMKNKIGKIEKISPESVADKFKGGSDQDFLNAFYPDWPQRKWLHLDHKYNMISYHLDEYKNLFGYSLDSSQKPVFIIHYASSVKPWHLKERGDSFFGPDKSLESVATQMWSTAYEEVNASLRKHD